MAAGIVTINFMVAVILRSAGKNLPLPSGWTAAYGIMEAIISGGRFRKDRYFWNFRFLSFRVRPFFWDGGFGSEDFIGIEIQANLLQNSG